MSGKSESETPPVVVGNGFGRAVLWLAGSALFGSVALALWNRRVLNSMREAVEIPEEPVRPRDEDGIY